MAINIPSLFSDIIGTDEQRRLQMLQEGDLLARQLTGNLRTGAGASLGQRLTATAAPTVTAIAGQLPQRREDTRRAAGGMLGLDVRTEGEKVADVLGEGFETDAEGLRDLSRRLVRIAPVQAAGLMQAADERELGELQLKQLQTATKNAEGQAQAQERYRRYVAGLARKSEKYAGFAPLIERGDVPEERMKAIVDELVKTEDPTQLSIVQARVGEENKTLQTDGFGTYYLLNGEEIELGPNDRVSKASAAGSFEDVTGISDERRESLIDQEIATYNFVSTANTVLEQLEKTPDANTRVATLAGLADDLYAEGKAIMERFAPDVSTNEDDYESLNLFGGLGTEGSRFKSAVFGLALQYAAASGLGSGRSLTDRDIDRAIRAIAADRADPTAIAAVINDKKLEVINQFKGAYRVTTKSQYEGEIDAFPAPEDQGVDGVDDVSQYFQ